MNLPLVFYLFKSMFFKDYFLHTLVGSSMKSSTFTHPCNVVIGTPKHP